MGSLLLKYLVDKTCNFKLEDTITKVILGHSHTECDLDDSLIPNVKNLSQGGEAYFYTYQKAKKLLAENKNIKTLYISFSNNQISKEMDRWTFDDIHINNGFPKYSSQIKGKDYRFLLNKNLMEVLKAENKAVLYNGKALFSRRDIVNSDWGGYLKIKQAKVDSLIKTDLIQKTKRLKWGDISMTNIIYLQKIINLCDAQKVKPVLIRMPLYPDYFKSLDETTYQTVRKKYFRDVEFHDFHDFPLDISEYRDYHHLNYKGAPKFSLYFNNYIKNHDRISE